MSNLQSQLNQLEKSPKFQKMITAAQKEAAKKGKPFGQGDSAISKALVLKRCERMRSLLYEETVQVIPSIKLEDIEIGQITVDESGCYAVNIGFNREAVHRDSLYPQKYDGIDNIVLHLTHGWTANDYVYGNWHGDNVRSKVHADSNDFIQRAAERFNNEMKGTAQVSIDTMYL